MNVGALRGLCREPQRVPDLARHHLLVPDQARQDREPRRVGRRPAIRAKVVGGEVKDRPGAGGPRPIWLRPRVEQFVQKAVLPIHPDHVTVAIAVGSAFDRRVVGDRIRAWVTLVRIQEADLPKWCVGVDLVGGDAVGVALPAGPEVGMQISPNRVHPGGRPLVHVPPADVGVPRVVRREHGAGSDAVGVR